MITNTTDANFNVEDCTITNKTIADPPPTDNKMPILGDLVMVKTQDAGILSAIPMGTVLALAHTRKVRDGDNPSDRILWNEKIIAAPNGPLNVELVVMSTADKVATRIPLPLAMTPNLVNNNMMFSASACFSQPGIDGNTKRLCDVRVQYADEDGRRYISIFVMQYIEGQRPSGPENPIKSICESVVNKPFIPYYDVGIVIPQTISEGEQGITVICNAFRKAVTTMDYPEPHYQCIAAVDHISVPFMEFLIRYRLATEGQFKVGTDGDIQLYTRLGPSSLIMKKQMTEHPNLVDTIDIEGADAVAEIRRANELENGEPSARRVEPDALAGSGWEDYRAGRSGLDGKDAAAGAMEVDANGDGAEDDTASKKKSGRPAFDEHFTAHIYPLFQLKLTGSKQASKRLERFKAINAVHTRLGQKWLGSFVDTPLQPWGRFPLIPEAYRDALVEVIQGMPAYDSHNKLYLYGFQFVCLPVNDADSDGYTATKIENWQINIPTGSTKHCLGPYNNDGTLSTAAEAKMFELFGPIYGNSDHWRIFPVSTVFVEAFVIQSKPFMTSQGGITTLYEKAADGKTYQAAHAEAGMSTDRMSEFNSNNTPAPFIHLPDHYLQYAKNHKLGKQQAKPADGGRRARGRGRGTPRDA